MTTSTIWGEHTAHVRLSDDSPVSALISRGTVRIMKNYVVEASGPIVVASGDHVQLLNRAAYTPEGFGFRRYFVIVNGDVAFDWDDRPLQSTRRVWDWLTNWNVRPRVLRRALVLAAFGAILAGTGIGWAADASADPVDDYTAINAGAICMVLDDNPNTAGLLGVMEGVHAEGLSTEDAGHVVYTAIEVWCPRHWPLLIGLTEVDDETVIV